MRAVVRVERLQVPSVTRPPLELGPAGKAGPAAGGAIVALDPHEALGLQGQGSAQQGHLQLGRPAPLTAEQAGGERQRSQQAGGEVGEREAPEPRRHAIARARVGEQQPGQRLGDQVVGGAPGVRAAAAEGRHADHHAVGVGGAHAVAVEGEAAGPLGQAVVNEPVRPGDQLATGAPARLALQVEGHGALAAVERVEVPALALGERVVAAPLISLRRLDLDHVRTQVGQQHGRERPGHVLPVVEYSAAGQRQAAVLIRAGAHRASPSHASSTASAHTLEARTRRWPR